MPMLEVVKGKKEENLVLMTRPDGNPCEVPAARVGDFLKKDYKKGYIESKEVTAKRAANKIDYQKENIELKQKLTELTKKLESIENIEPEKKRGRKPMFSGE